MPSVAVQILAWILIVGGAISAYYRYGLNSFPFLFLAGTWFYLLFLPYAVGPRDVLYGMEAYATSTYYISVPVYAFFYALAVRLAAPMAFRKKLSSAKLRRNPASLISRGSLAYAALLTLSVALCIFSLASRNVLERDGILLFTILGFDLLIVCYFLRRNQRRPFINVVIFICLIILFFYAGFRYRIILLFMAEMLVYLSGRGSRGLKGLLIAGSLFGVLALAAVGQVRVYGSFDTLKRLPSVNLNPIELIARSGEQTVYFATVNVIENLEKLDLVGLKPLALVPTQFIPAAIWPDKPRPDYLGSYLEVSDGLGGSGAAMHDIAQAALMFGHLGLPFASFLLGLIAGLMMRVGLRLSPNAYYASGLIFFFAVLIPSRGYLAQQFTWMATFVLPIYLLSLLQQSAIRPRKSRLVAGAKIQHSTI